ncbi:hypothetical protein HJC23_005677 [Cyclotella cryptica]|uniref:Uncharacterized protein n=1 Tax=Cyclotella cryptica TaxID=29204 RepID=A0ABD3PD46_9STRA
MKSERLLFLARGIVALFFLLSIGSIHGVDASSLNNGASVRSHPIGNVASTMANSQIDGNSNSGQSFLPPNENASPNSNGSAIANPHESEVPSDFPITDESSALAAKYASANIVTGDILTSQTNRVQSRGASPSGSSTSSGGGWFGKILGKGSSPASDDGKNIYVAHRGSGGLPPPPPPPPLSKEVTNQQQQQQQQWKDGSIKQVPQHQKQQQQHLNPNYNPYTSTNNYPPYNPPPAYVDPATYQNLLYELDESTLREMTLTHQLHNLSSYVDSLTSESENLVLRIDVLTERLADTNADFNYVHNRNLELQQNCTQLAETVETLKEEIAGYEGKISSMEDEKSESEKILLDLRGELRRVTDELEQLACLVETERFEMEKSEFLRDFKRKQGLKRRKKKGFWAWLFGFESEEREDDTSGEEQERLRAAQELARSTLLHALQTERANVEELEAAVVTLQRNNSAIMDVVQSRNSLINELNDRVAVFEEDKMVLKAALRQLQKEIREEGPKLEKALEGERMVREELEQLTLKYQEEREEWKQRFEEGEAEWNQTKEELFLIGTYVDQLEDRLANFAIAKKEIEAREKRCQELEADAQKHIEEAESWKSQVEALTREQGETKPLLEDLVKERAETRVKVDGLLNEIKELNEQIEDWKRKVEEVEHHSEEIKSQSARQLFLTVEESKREWEAEAARRIEEQKQLWGVAKAKEWKETLEAEKAAWQSQSKHDVEQRLSQEKAIWEGILRDRQSSLEANLLHDWNAKLSNQRAELESRFQNELERIIDSERSNWQEQKEQEIHQRLMEERALCEASFLKKATDSSALENEVEKAASKVYHKLEKNGFSFGTSESSLEQMKDFFQVVDNVKNEKEARKSDDSDTSTLNTTETHDLLAPNVTMQNTTAARKVSLKGPSKSLSRTVPFRAVRKALSRATGMHGLITPSSVQLRQRSMRAHRRPPRKSQQKKDSQEDDPQSQQDDCTKELSLPQASTNTNVDDQLWDTEAEKTSEPPMDFSNGGEDLYQSENSVWNCDSEGTVELLSSLEPPPLPDLDDR